MQHHLRLSHLVFSSVRFVRGSLLNSSHKYCIVITANNPATALDFVPAVPCNLLGGDLEKLARAQLPLEVVFLGKVDWVDDGLDGGLDVGCVRFASDYICDLLAFTGLDAGMNNC